jgi:hypothetical protein
MVSSLLHVVVFMLVNALVALGPALVAAVAVAVVIAIWRLARREPLLPALVGLFGIGVCALTAYCTGEAKGFFLLGIWFSALLCVVCTISVLMRWPLAGAIWHGINGDGQSWRADNMLLRTYTMASLFWAAMFGAKFAVQEWLYSTDQTRWLATAEIATGPPLTALALLGTFWAVRRARRRATTQPKLG